MASDFRAQGATILHSSFSEASATHFCWILKASIFSDRVKFSLWPNVYAENKRTMNIFRVIAFTTKRIFF